MTEHVLLISVGPIQDFIASARRCQDLWFGSWMLSDLSRTVAEAIRASCGDVPALVFPAGLQVGTTDDSKPAVANKILAVIPAPLLPAEVAASARRAMMARLDDLAQAAFDRLPPDKRFHRETALQQIADLLEYVWVAVPLASRADYATARASAELLLGARKNRRSWSQTSWGASVPKCSLDGLRESVLDESLFEAFERVDRRGDRMSARELRSRWFVKKGERLCGVGLLKRVGSEVDLDGRFAGRPVFHSTSHVATGPLVARVARLGREAEVERYAGALAQLIEPGAQRLPSRLLVRRARVYELASPFEGSIGVSKVPSAFGESCFDGRLLFEGQLPAILEETSPDYADAPERGDSRRKIERTASALLRSLLSSLELSTESVPAYYAVLLADGDNLGKALDDVGRSHGLDGHRKLASALDDFSVDCRRIVEDHGGSLVYSGGDDVLALLPLHTALACSRTLHTAFTEAVGRARSELGAAAPTLSVGLGIAHHLDDMAEARELARESERRAKAVPGKNALAVTLQLRSGGQLAVAGTWGGSRPLDERLRQWARLQALDAIPGKAAHELEAEMAPLLRRGVDGREATDMAEVARSLARRVLDRKRGGHGAEKLSSEVRELLSEAFAGGDVASRVTALSAELQIARLLADAYSVAFGELSVTPPEAAVARAAS